MESLPKRTESGVRPCTLSRSCKKVSCSGGQLSGLPASLRTKVMANQDSDRPPAPGKLPVLRKIPGGPKTLPPIAPPPRRSLPSLTDVGAIGAGVGNPRGRPAAADSHASSRARRAGGAGSHRGRKRAPGGTRRLRGDAAARGSEQRLRGHWGRQRREGLRSPRGRGSASNSVWSRSFVQGAATFDAEGRRVGRRSGVSLVALVVIGARMAYNSGSATGQGARISPAPLAMSVSTAAGGDPAHPTPVATVPSVPDLGARALASVRPPPRTVPAAIGPTPRVRPPAPPGSPVVAGSPLVASPPRVAASANPPPPHGSRPPFRNPRRPKVRARWFRSSRRAHRRRWTRS